MLQRTQQFLRTICLWIAVASIFAMFAIVAFNIIARAIFDATGGSLNAMIFGAIELAQYSLMISVFAAIPAVAKEGMIRVDILSQRFPTLLAMVFDRGWLLLIATFSMILTNLFFDETLTTLSRGDETQDLRIPLWIFYAIASIECAILSLLTLGDVFSGSRDIDEESN